MITPPVVFQQIVEMDGPLDAHVVARILGIHPALADLALDHLRMLGVLERREAGGEPNFVVTPWASERRREVAAALDPASNEVWTDALRESIRDRVDRALGMRPGTMIVYANDGTICAELDFKGCRDPHGRPAWYPPCAPLAILDVSDAEHADIRRLIDRLAADEGFLATHQTYRHRTKGPGQPIYELRRGHHLRFHPTSVASGEVLRDPLHGSEVRPPTHREVFRDRLQRALDHAFGARWTVRATPGISAIDIFPLGHHKGMARDHLIAGGGLGSRRAVVSVGDRFDGNDSPLLREPLLRADDHFLALSVSTHPEGLYPSLIAEAKAAGILIGHLGSGCTATEAFLARLLRMRRNGVGRRPALVRALREAVDTPHAAHNLEIAAAIAGEWTGDGPVALAFDIDGTINTREGNPPYGDIPALLRELDSHGYQIASITGKKMDRVQRENLLGFAPQFRASDDATALARRFRERADEYRRHTRECFVPPSPEDRADRRAFASIVGYLGMNPDLIDPDTHPGCLHALIDTAFADEDDDIRFHAAEASGRYLDDRSPLPDFCAAVDRVLEAYAASADVRAGARILALATRHRGSWIERRLAESPIGDAKKNLVDLQRDEFVTPARLRLGLSGDAMDQVLFLERAAKLAPLTAGDDRGQWVAEILARLPDNWPARFSPDAPWPVRALAADCAAHAARFDREISERLLHGMRTDPEAEVRVRMKRAFTTMHLVSAEPADHPLRVVARLLDEIDAEPAPGRIRFVNGAVIDLLVGFSPLTDDETGRAVRGLVDRLVTLARGHMDAYHRKSGVKICANLATRWCRIGWECAHLVGAALDAMSDEAPIVREEAFLSFAKRGCVAALDEKLAHALLDRLPAWSDAEDPSWMRSLAVMVPEFLARYYPDDAPPPTGALARDADGELARVAIEGGRKESRAVSLIRSELADYPAWLARVPAATLVRLGTARERDAGALYRTGLPDAFG